jgi:hypothetical protein
VTHSDEPPAEPMPPVPNRNWDGRSRAENLADWVGRHRQSFTNQALQRAALEAGYSAEAFEDANRVLEARENKREALGPIKTTSIRLTLVAYTIVWVGFAAVFLGNYTPSAYIPPGSVMQQILTVSLGIALGISLLLIRLGHPDPGRPLRAMTLLLAIPVILLLGVAGLCLPFTGAG